MKSLINRWLCFFLMASASVIYAADEIPPDSVITLQRHTCERHCAVYRVVLFGDGTVLYYGQYYVRRKGLVLSHVEPEVFRKLFESAKRINYFNLKSAYGYHGTSDCESRIPDQPIVSTSVTVGDQSHGVIHHHRCEGPIPAQLTVFEDEIEKLANTMQFTK
jgi:hypothetical protein